MTASPTLALLKGAKAPPPTPEEVLGGDTKATTVQSVAVIGKAKKPGKAKNALTTVKTLNGEVLGPDLLVTTAHEIENLSEAAATSMVATLTDTSDFNNFKLGGVLSKIFKEKWFGEFSDFNSYVVGVHGFKTRKAFYLMGNYEGLISLNISWDKLQPVGWSKLKELVSGDVPVINADNAEEWLAKASEDGMTVAKLNELVKAAKNEGQPQIEGGESSNKTTKKTLALHDDQLEVYEAAVAKAKAISGTDNDTVAVEYALQDFLANGEKVNGAGSEIEAPVKDMTLASAKKFLLKIGEDAVLELVGELFPTLETVNFKGEEASA